MTYRPRADSSSRTRRKTSARSAACTVDQCCWPVPSMIRWPASSRGEPRSSPGIAPPPTPPRFIYLDPAAREFFVDYDRIATDAAAMLRLEAGRNPHDKALITLVGELSTQSELFHQHWASHNVKFHRSGRKR